MKIATIRLAGFQSFGPSPIEIRLDDLTYLIGPNGSGKTAVLEALARLFGTSQALRRVRPEDFHFPIDPALDRMRELWIEVDVYFPETSDGSVHPSVPPFFGHMAIDDPGSLPRIRIRLNATLDDDGFVDEKIVYVTQVDAFGQPTKTSEMPRQERAAIEVHYLPARRDPSDHISYTPSSLVGRLLRAADWSAERGSLSDLSDDITASISENAAVASLVETITTSWSGLHKGPFLKEPRITFGRGELEGVLSQLNISFAPSTGGGVLAFERLSDGQKSLLYVSLVVASLGVAREVLAGTNSAFDPDKLRPPVHTIIAIEEPENSLSPHYLGRIIRLIKETTAHGDAQAVLATHAPGMLKRVDPTAIRYLRLDENRSSQIREIALPGPGTEDAKFVREAVESFPELYFSRLVVLGEGDSEQIVIPRILAAAGIAEDDASVSVVPLGGRFVHHFWRLLDGLDIPYLTLLDLDAGRFQGGWGRLSYAVKRVNAVRPGTFVQEQIDGIAAWNADKPFPEYKLGESELALLEAQGVFFSGPIDLDMILLEAYPDAYGAVPETPGDADIAAVLGKSHANDERHRDEIRNLFVSYHKHFKLVSKPATHISAMAGLSDDELLDGLPDVLKRLIEAMRLKLTAISE